jgi:MGS-like domain-containing protein
MRFVTIWPSRLIRLERGSELRSTGEVMGVAEGFGSAYLKAQQGLERHCLVPGRSSISVNAQDKRGVMELARELHEMGFKMVATRGTQKRIESAGLPCEFVYKVNEGRPNVADLVKSRQIDLIINTALGRTSFYDERSIRRASYSVLGSVRDDDDRRSRNGSGDSGASRRRASSAKPSGLSRSSCEQVSSALRGQFTKTRTSLALFCRLR